MTIFHSLKFSYPYCFPVKKLASTIPFSGFQGSFALLRMTETVRALRKKVSDWPAVLSRIAVQTSGNFKCVGGPFGKRRAGFSLRSGMTILRVISVSVAWAALLFQIHMLHRQNLSAQKLFPQPPEFLHRIGGHEAHSRLTTAARAGTKPCGHGPRCGFR